VEPQRREAWIDLEGAPVGAALLRVLAAYPDVHEHATRSLGLAEAEGCGVRADGGDRVPHVSQNEVPVRVGKDGGYEPMRDRDEYHIEDESRFDRINRLENG
jgi:hypothetical protein